MTNNEQKPPIREDDRTNCAIGTGPKGGANCPIVMPETETQFEPHRYRRISQVVSRYSLPLLRTSLAVVYVWFGALKAAGVTPVADLVAASIPWVDPIWFVPILGLAEILLGFALLTGRLPIIVGLLVVLHLAGTFLVLVMQPGLAFQNGHPLLLTTIGEFVVKNVVLASAAIAVSVTPQRSPPTHRDAWLA